MKFLTFGFMFMLTSCSTLSTTPTVEQVRAEQEQYLKSPEAQAQLAAQAAHRKYERSRKEWLCTKNDLPKDCLDD